MFPSQILVAIDVGCARHRVAAGLSDGKVLEEFDIGHYADGFQEFFSRVGKLDKFQKLFNFYINSVLTTSLKKPMR